MRQSRCRDCGHLFDVATVTGPLPSKCDPCDPEAAERRQAHRGDSNRRNAGIRAARERIEQLERQLRQGRPARLSPSTPAGRNTVAIAVRRVGTAEGRDQTGQRLRELAAEALAWADALGCSETAPPADLTTTEAAA